MTRASAQTINRSLAAAFFILAGANHFRAPDFYRRIVPPVFPSPSALVGISGFFETAGGIGLLIPRLRRPAGWGLIALLVAVFPANVYMAVTNHPDAAMGLPAWVRWARLPLQLPMMGWVWSASLGRSAGEGSLSRYRPE